MKAISKVVESDLTKSDKARQLYDLGLERTEVVELVGMNYSQAHSIWKEKHGGSRRDGSVARRTKAAATGALRGDLDAARPAGRQSRALYLTPSQTRYLTQDGHEVVRVDKTSGAECYNCGRPVAFFLKWLGFLHSGSNSEPTNIEDRYEQ